MAVVKLGEKKWPEFQISSNSNNNQMYIDNPQR